MMHRLQTFLIGRNGPDELSKATSIAACVLLVITLIVRRGIVSSILWVFAAACLFLSYWRMLSKNITKRQQENQLFLNRVAPVTTKWAQLKTRRRQRKLYSFFKCPECGTVLRVPKGKGKVRITCKSCSYKFERNS